VVVPFIAGYDDVAGKTLKLDHITDPNLRPLDELFRDHFLQCVLKRMKVGYELPWDYEEALDDDVDLSNDIWSGKKGKEHFEFELASRLHDFQVAQSSV
jgi:hypothetical protein